MDFIAVDELDAILRHMRTELVKTVLEAARPRTFDYETGLPVSGGYGLDFASYSGRMPNHWNTSAHDELCPVLEARRYSDVETGSGVGSASQVGISPFLPEEIKDSVDSVSNALLLGSGIIVVSLFGDSQVSPDEVSTLGQDITESNIRLTIKVSKDSGLGQAYLYAGILARVFSDQVVFISNSVDSGTNYLKFGLVPEVPESIESEGDWAEFEVIYNAMRHYKPRSAILN